MIENNREPIGRNIKPKFQAEYRVNNLQFKIDSCIYNYKINNNKISTPVGKNNKSFGKYRWVWLIIKLFLILFIILLITYGFFLNKKIRNRIDGKIWQLPAAVYGRTINLEPNMIISKTEMIKLLKAAQYRQVLKIAHPGEFNVQYKSIEIVCRPFDFPDSKKEQISVRLKFNKNRIAAIENINNNRQLGFFRLDPRLITTLFSPNNGEERLFVARSDFPDLLVEILLAAEDRYFYKHEGVNLYSIGRAIIANINAKRTVQGASTLTQQLVKNLFLTNERSYWRKANEAYMALLMDAHYSKDRILEIYMNEVYLGQIGDHEIRGFPLASIYYFGRPVKELNIEQQALLVGMVKGASVYNPWRNPKLAIERRNLVLNLLQQQKIISQNLYNKLIACPLNVQPRGSVISPQPAFMQMVLQELQRKLNNKINNLSGARIFTTLDSVTQEAAEKAVIEGMSTLKKRYNLKDLETAMVIVDRYSGEVRAIVGGADPQYAGYNRATQARRSIGSLAKPATYLTALSQPNKYQLNTLIINEPISLRQPNGQIWSPQNDDRKFSGKVMLVDALARSLNIPTVNLGMDLGLTAITDTWQKLGVARNQLNSVPSMILGALNLTPIEVAQAFQTIASGGNRATLSVLRSVTAEDGTILYHSYPQAERVVPIQAAYLTMWAMQQVMKTGTGHQLGEKYPDLYLAGKTGTTNNNVDAWFAGIDGREVVIIWVGRDNNQPTKLYGSSGAMSIYQCYLSNHSPTPLKLRSPEGIVHIGIDEIGNFVCSNIERKLPAWTINPETLCQDSHQQLTNQFDYSSTVQNYRRESSFNSINNLIKMYLNY